MPTLIGADFQQFRRSDAVKPCPVKARIGMMHFANHRCHQRHSICFALCQRANARGKAGIIKHKTTFPSVQSKQRSALAMRPRPPRWGARTRPVGRCAAKLRYFRHFPPKDNLLVTI
jgi:hypothetical protein